MSEPTYLILDENEDFSMQAHVDSDGYQRVAVQGYLQKSKSDGLYRAPLIPELFFGADGTQLQTWRQYLHAGEQTILSRDGGNPHVPDHELAWRKIGETRQPVPQQPVQQTVNLEIPVVPILALVAIPLSIYLLYKVTK